MLAELATLFTEKVVASSDGVAAKPKASAVKIETVVDTRRATHVGVALARLSKSMDAEQVVGILPNRPMIKGLRHRTVHLQLVRMHLA